MSAGPPDRPPPDPRDAGPQWVLPLVVRVERADPPARTDALEAAAIAVLTLLADPRSRPAGDPARAGDPAAGGGDPPAGPAGDVQIPTDPSRTDRARGDRSDGTGIGQGDVGQGDVGQSDGGRGDVGRGDVGRGDVGQSDGGRGDVGRGDVGRGDVGRGDVGRGDVDEGPDGPPGGEWAAAVRGWTDSRIRKVVRRARGAEWRRAAVLDGVTVARRTAEVRVFPPVPLDGWPRDLARLQVSGTDLADPAEPPPPAAGVPVLWLDPHLELTAGKAMAQVGHAAQLGWDALDPASRDRWRATGFELAVRTAAADRWDELVRSGLPLVRDAGFTEIAAGTCTAVADHPALS